MKEEVLVKKVIVLYTFLSDLKITIQELPKAAIQFGII